MNVVSWLALAVTVGWLSGCASTTGSKVVNIPLNATPLNAGHIAQATLVPIGNETGISFSISGIPNDIALPPHFTTYIYSGTCEHLGPKPAAAMSLAMTGDYVFRAPGWQFSKETPMPIGTLRSGGYAIVVRSGPMEGNADLFCGNII